MLIYNLASLEIVFFSLKHLEIRYISILNYVSAANNINDEV